ncbi:MAG: DUF1917 domain-containing protein [Anaerolineae bacterium]
MPDYDKPNLDLIRMVQQARMAHDADAVPSQVSAVYWIESKPREPQQTPTSRTGAWRISTDLQHVDALWAQVKAATENGSLGYKSKVATASHSGSVNAREIRVCTYDSADSVDVQRVGDALRALGVADEMVYRAD